MICWYWLKDHKLTACKTFISLNLNKSKSLLKKNNFVGIVGQRDKNLRTVRQPQIVM